MMTATIFVHPQGSFQFLSICHYITSFGLFFYNNDLITIGERDQTIPVLNAFFEYLNKSNNEFEAKRQLLQKVLKGTDLYGGGKNETLDVEYVNKHYQYIISEALFSHYGNINGYLSEIINTADNLTFSAFKRRVVEHINRRYSSKDYCSSGLKSSKILNPLAKEKVFQDYVWSMFPEPEEDMNIMDVNYIYAMVGLKIARSTQLDTSNLTFDNYILLSRSLDFKSLDDEAYQSMLLFFSTPALFFYAQKEKERYRQLNISSLSDAFWNEAYAKLFSYLNEKIQEIVQGAFNSSLYGQLQASLSNLKNRTFVGYEIMKEKCNGTRDETVLQRYVSVYKSLPLWLAQLFIPGVCYPYNLPDLADKYAEQFVEVRKLHNDMEKNSIHQALVDGDLITKLNEPNITVWPAKLPNYAMGCSNCPPMPRIINEEIYLLFAIKQDKKIDFYALRQEEGVLTLLQRNGNEKTFSEALGHDSSINVEVSPFANYLKLKNEDSQAFIQRVADKKSNQFINQLTEFYRHPTVFEKVIAFIKSCVPFYSCVQNIRSGNQGAAGFSCTLDVFTLIPIVGVTAKYATIIKSSFIAEMHESILATNVILRKGISTSAAIRTTFSEILKAATRTAVSEILKKRVLKDFAVAAVRTLDPGFELSYQISRLGWQLFNKMFENVLSMTKRFSKIHKLLPSMETVSQVLQRNMNKVVDHTGMVPTVVGKLQDGHEIVRYTFPGGSHFFGPKCLTVLGKTVEMRSMINYPLEIPVVPSKESKVLNSYRRINLKTGKESDFDLELDNNDLLRRVGNFLNRIEWDGLDMSELRDFDVYYNTFEKNKPHAEANPNGDVPHLAPSEEINAPQSMNPDVPETSRGSAAGGQESKVEVPGGSKRKSSWTGETDSNNPAKVRKTETAQEGSEIPARVADTNQGIDDIPSTSKGSRTSLVKVKDDSFIETKLNDKELSYLKTLKEKRLSIRTEEKETLNNFRLKVNRLALKQMDKNWLKEPMELWRTEVIRNWKVVQYLKTLKGSSFFFNDVTLLTSKAPGISTVKAISLDAEIRYNLKIHSQYGILDLSQIDPSFENQYITFPEVFFRVNEITYSNKDFRSVLTLELQQQRLTKEDWIINRKSEIENLLIQKVKSKRFQSIERAADIISSQVPLFTNSLSEEMLMEYILNLEPSSILVPSYETLANIYSKTMDIPHSYDKWKIKNSEYINDLLFDAKLDDISDVSVARKGIDQIYGGIYKENVEEAFKIYKNSPESQKSLRFEDYYVIRSYVHNTLIKNKDTNRRKLAALFRLALRQSDEEWVKTPITLYGRIMAAPEAYSKYITLSKNDPITFTGFTPVRELRSVEESKLLNDLSDSSRKPIFLEIKLTNQAGVASLNNILKTVGRLHFIPSTMELVVDGLVHEKIGANYVLVVKMHDLEIPTEDRMVDIVKELDLLFSTETDFYINQRGIPE